MIIDALIGSGFLPDPLIRRGIRRLLRQRRDSLNRGPEDARRQREKAFIESLRRSPIAIHQDAANAQHYEVPARFFELVLGKRLKYSSAYWKSAAATLDEAEEAMLALTCERALVAPGQEILELGCGWGSLTLFLAQAFPSSRVLAISNSRTQREFIVGRAQALSLTNIEIVTADVSHWAPNRKFDRIVSVEMFEHLRNWPEMFGRVASWLKPEGRFFMHVFTHKEHSYPFEDDDDSDFMSRHFFSGGMMPADGLARALGGPLQVEEHWRVEGTHYAKTAAAWLANMDAHRAEVEAVLGETYGAESRKFWHYWRVFFMACEELWAFDSGSEWLVSHYRFQSA